MIAKILKSLAALIFVAIVCVFAVFFAWKRNCESFLENTLVSGNFIIEKGASYSTVYDTVFGSADVPKGFDYYLRLMLKLPQKAHYGYYDADNTSLSALLGNVMSGKQTLTKVTFPEGYNMYNIAAALETAQIVGQDEMLAVFLDRGLIEELTGGSYESLEGFLAPGTYFFAKKYPPEKIAAKMVSDFYKTVPENFEVMARAQGLSFYEALTLASIVQKETYNAEESPLVAGVFLNRLKKKMLLQADPTIIYGKYTEFDGKIRYRDLRNSENRYNTYQHKGLTPTPICNPSAMALDAVINPADTKYIYFVAQQDGRHIFAETYDEHRRNVRIHQLGQSR